MECRHLRCSEREAKRSSPKYPTMRHLRQHEKRGWLHPCHLVKEEKCKCCEEYEKKGVKLEHKRPARDKKKTSSSAIHKRLKQKRISAGYPFPTSTSLNSMGLGSYPHSNLGSHASPETAVLMSQRKPFRLPDVLPAPMSKMDATFNADGSFENASRGDAADEGEDVENEEDATEKYDVRPKSINPLPIYRLPLVLPPPLPINPGDYPLQVQQKVNGFDMNMFPGVLNEGETGRDEEPKEYVEAPTAIVGGKN